MIIYNGATGGIGRYLGKSIGAGQEAPYPLRSRMEDRAGLIAELAPLNPVGQVTFIHLAARVSVPACESDPTGAFRTNVALARATAATVLDWASLRGLVARVVYVSSGHVYAAQADGSRLAEDAPTNPRSVYARTKLEAEEDLRQLCATTGAPLLIARVFGLLGPGQAAHYVLPSLIERARTRQLDAIPGLDFTRDYLDARDVCSALALLASMPWPVGDVTVNICSGEPVTIRELLRQILVRVDPTHADELHRQASTAPGREDDIRWLVGDPTRFTELTSESPMRIPLDTTVADAVRAAT